MDDFEKYLNKQLKDTEFKAEWDKLESERDARHCFQKKYPRVRFCVRLAVCLSLIP